MERDLVPLALHQDPHHSVVQVKDEKTMKQNVLIFMLITAVAVGGCGPSQIKQPPIGKGVTVQFRRDALGSAHTLPVPPTTDSQNGAQVSLIGTLVLVNAEWVVLKHSERDHWVPREAVLLIRVNE
jgi:hypothetical protein